MATFAQTKTVSQRQALRQQFEDSCRPALEASTLALAAAPTRAAAVS